MADGETNNLQKLFEKIESIPPISLIAIFKNKKQVLIMKIIMFLPNNSQSYAQLPEVFLNSYLIVFVQQDGRLPPVFFQRSHFSKYCLLRG